MRPLIVICVLVVACGSVPEEPALTFGDNTPEDLRALASATFDATSDAFPGQQDCLGHVVLAGAWELDDRARYRPDRSEITLRIPATARQLETSMVHELAHHLEFSCPTHPEMRQAFLEAQGFEPGTDWYEASTWETTPSEQWASAVVMFVLDRPDERSRIVITPAALDVVREWAQPS